MAKLYNQNVKFVCDDTRGFMSLYAVNEAQAKGKKPIIFIRGHAGRYTVNTKKILDHAPHNYQLIKQHEGFWYDDSIHKPYIAEFAYRENIRKKFSKSDITMQMFSNAVIELIKKSNLKQVDMVAASAGGNIAMLCSPCEEVDRVSVVSPVMPYTYLADIEQLTQFKNRSLLERVLYEISKLYLDQEYGFVRDMNHTYRDAKQVKNMIDPHKCFIEAGDAQGIMSQTILGRLKEFADVLSAKTISKATGYPSDGAVVTDQEYYKQLGVLYEIQNDVYHVYCDQKEYLLKRAYLNLEKIKTYTII